MFLNAIKAVPHAEEACGARRLEARKALMQASMQYPGIQRFGCVLP
jgi:hypothetical protein